MRRLLTVFLLLSFWLTFPAFSQEKSRPKVALVLSGGGAKGFAHIAVLEALEEEGIPVDLITGTSMGALVGSLYASGYSPKDIREIVSSNDMMTLLLDKASAIDPFYPEAFSYTDDNLASLSFSEYGFGAAPSVLGDGKILNFLATCLLRDYNIENFDQLPIPFRAVATDLLTSEEIVFDHGSLLQAVRCSMSLPLLFTPAPTGDGRYALDGGIVNNMPVKLAADLGADIIIASDVGTTILTRVNQLQTLDSMASHVYNLMVDPKVVVQYPYADVLIRHDVSPYGTLSFPFSDEIIAKGKIAVDKKRDEIHAIALSLQEQGITLTPQEYDRVSYYQSLKNPVVDSVVIRDISINDPVPLPDPDEYAWIIQQELTDQLITRLSAQLSQDRKKFNLASFSFETAPGLTDETCTLVLRADHYNQNPSSISIGGTPALYIHNQNGVVGGTLRPELNLRIRRNEPFFWDIYSSIGKSLMLGFNLRPVITTLLHNSLQLDTGAQITYGGLMPQSAYTYFDKPLLEDIGFSAHLGVLGRYLYYGTVAASAEYNLFNLQTIGDISGMIQTATGKLTFAADTLQNEITGWNGFRMESIVEAGASFSNHGVTPTGRYTFSWKRLFALDPQTSSVGLVFQFDSREGDLRLTSNYADYGGYHGICGYAPGTFAKGFALAGLLYQHRIFNIFGLPTILQTQLKVGATTPGILLFDATPEAGYALYLILHSPIGNFTLGGSHSVTNGRFCLMIGLQ